MDILVAFIIGSAAGGFVMAFLNGCANNKLIEESYMKGFLAGQKDKR